jgi:hypothetical protein
MKVLTFRDEEELGTVGAADPNCRPVGQRRRRNRRDGAIPSCLATDRDRNSFVRL